MVTGKKQTELCGQW